jgi:hypothetical protein
MKIGPKPLTNLPKCAKIVSTVRVRSEVYIAVKDFPGTALNTLIISLVIVLLSLKELVAVGAVSGRRA